MAFEELSRKYGISHQRVRQIELRAMQKLRGVMSQPVDPPAHALPPSRSPAWPVHVHHGWSLIRSSAERVCREQPDRVRDTFGEENKMASTVGGIEVPDSKLAREITEIVRDTVTRCCSIIPVASGSSEPWRASVAA